MEHLNLQNKQEHLAFLLSQVGSSLPPLVIRGTAGAAGRRIPKVLLLPNLSRVPDLLVKLQAKIYRASSPQSSIMIKYKCGFGAGLSCTAPLHADMFSCLLCESGGKMSTTCFHM